MPTQTIADLAAWLESLPADTVQAALRLAEAGHGPFSVAAGSFEAITQVTGLDSAWVAQPQPVDALSGNLLVANGHAGGPARMAASARLETPMTLGQEAA